ncbi:MAG TPA: hypothetical protein VGU24_20395 [Microvirga sp.]|jgi:hypothetical protein|nr:hypothetical protein [Microvirga sp.]
MFTLEIKGKAIVVTNATQDEAAGLFESEEFKEDLKTLTSEGQPLWDGSAPLTVRPASEDEVDSFDEAMNDEEYEDEDDADDDDEPIDVVFLVEIDAMDDDEYDGPANDA